MFPLLISPNTAQGRYGDPEIFVSESGVDVPGEAQLRLEDALRDDFRINYFKVKHPLTIPGQ